MVKEIFNRQKRNITLADKATAGDPKKQLEVQFPEMKNLASYMIAVENNRHKER